MHDLTKLRKSITLLYGFLLLSILIDSQFLSLMAQDLPVNESTLDQDQDIEYDEDENTDEEIDETEPQHKKIRNIIIEGNNSGRVTNEAILMRIPFRVGDIFNPAKTGELIRNLYALNFFNNIAIDVEDLTSNEINLIIRLQQKKRVEGIRYEGNKNLKEDEIEKKLHLNDLQAMDEEELEFYADQIKKLYAEKNYHAVSITTQLCPTERETHIATFTIQEGRKAVVKRVFFVGNKCVQSRTLRKLLMFTREDWLFGFIDKAGTYNPELIEGDKFFIESYYQNNGFLTAKVIDVKVDIDPQSQCIAVTFRIEEGDKYTIKNLSAIGNQLLTEQQIISILPLKPGQLYSRDLIRQAIDRLRAAWGSFGYIYADIEPIIQPNFIDKTVDITFSTELGNCVRLNRVNIIGNCKTRDYVIRRMLILNEGEKLTTTEMDISKNRVESLGFFDPKNGVEWKINKVSEGLVDLDLLLNEIKTGRLYGQIGYGGADPQSPSKSLRVSGGVSDRNLLGTGIRYNLNLSWSKEEQTVIFNLFQPWLFDYPVGVGVDAYHRRSTYEDTANLTNQPPTEKVTGATGQVVFSPQAYPNLGIVFNGGVDKIEFTSKDITARDSFSNQNQQRLLQNLVDRRFKSGTLNWVGGSIGQDLRNHPVFPNRGYNWSFSTKAGLPAFCSDYGYFKFDLDFNWLTPLINEYDLIFLLRGHFGLVKPFLNKDVPYRELYHIGGPTTVRGFNYGEIGPQINCDSIGAQKAFWVNAELIFAITQAQTVRGVLFYDGGAGWDTPGAKTFQGLPLQNNHFRYRHSIGFGLRLTSPAPIKVDWGFKLDRNKKLGESFYEVHFTMAQEF